VECELKTGDEDRTATARKVMEKGRAIIGWEENPERKKG